MGKLDIRKEINKGKEYSFIYVGGQHLARVNGVVGGSGKKFYYQNDHLGSALAITDENGNKVVERDFTPFGEKIKLEEMDGEDPDEDGSAFTGKDWDEDVGLYYYNARWYDPEVGRFISEDSVADDPSLYGYCGQNPISFTDPTGHFKLEIKFKTGFAFGMAALGVVESIVGTDSSFSNFISLISAVKGMKDFADYLKTVRQIEKTLSSTVNPDTGKKYTQKEVIIFMRSLYYQTPKFDSACGSSIDEQAIANMLEQKSPGIMNTLGFSIRVGKNEGEYNPKEMRWRADKTVYSVYGESVDVGHIWTGLDAGINGGNILPQDIELKLDKKALVNDSQRVGYSAANLFTGRQTAILGVTVTGDIVSTAGFSNDNSDLMGDLYGAVLGNRISKLNVNKGQFSISNYLASYFAPKGGWNKVATEFVKTYMNNETIWFSNLDIAGKAIRGKTASKLEKSRDLPYAVNSYIFYTRIMELKQHGR